MPPCNRGGAIPPRWSNRGVQTPPAHPLRSSTGRLPPTPDRARTPRATGDPAPGPGSSAMPSTESLRRPRQVADFAPRLGAGVVAAPANPPGCAATSPLCPSAQRPDRRRPLLQDASVRYPGGGCQEPKRRVPRTELEGVVADGVGGRGPAPSRRLPARPPSGQGAHGVRGLDRSLRPAWQGRPPPSPGRASPPNPATSRRRMSS